MSVTKSGISKKYAKSSRKRTTYSKLRNFQYVEAKRPTKAEIAKTAKGAKSYDEQYLKAFYKKNRKVIDYNLSKKETLELYGGNTYKMFKEMVLDKMFKVKFKGGKDYYQFNKKITDPYEKKELTTKEAIEKVYNSGDMWGEKQVQTNNLKKTLKEQGYDLRTIRDPKTGRIMSINQLEFIKKDVNVDPTGKQTKTYYYKIGNKVLVVHQSPKGGTIIDLVDEDVL